MTQNHPERVAKVVTNIEGRMKGNQFEKFIDFVEFPNYKNFQKGMRVEFQFPLSVVVGQNGCGKTSLLHALYGAPGGQTPGKWWFGTELDPIQESVSPPGQTRRLDQAEKAAFWYGYHDVDGTEREVVKTRIRKPGNPDYWEPSRPIAGYGMRMRPDKSRDPAIVMDSVYLNLKTQLNAFDRAFYYSEPDEFVGKIQSLRYWTKLKEQGRKGAATIQDFLRFRSKSLKKALVHSETKSDRAGPRHKERVVLSSEELATISHVIGRDYTTGFLLEHRFYGGWGMSAYFRTENRAYSEAFAGSGESAVAQLVHEVMSGDTHRLLLIDEPETSLHPGAQERLLVFLLEQIGEKSLQVVISSHSPVFVRHLPEKAIHVLRANLDGKVEHRQGINAEEAFHSIGHPPENVCQIYVEDILAKQMLDAVIAEEDDALSQRVQVSFCPGGTGDMRQDAANLQHHDFADRVHYVFDGDQKVFTPSIDIGKIAIDATSSDLDRLIKKSYGAAIRFRQNSGTPEDDKVEMRLDFIKFANTRFHCMPFITPETVLWNDEAAQAMIAPFASDAEELPDFASLDPKGRFDALAKLLQPENEGTDSREINMFQKIFLKRFVSAKGEDFQALRTLILKISNDA